MQRISFKIAKWMIILMSVLQLAVSQIHIKAITVMFARPLGFYLFLFILFGMLLIFFMTSMKKIDLSLIFKLTLTDIVASGSAIYCAILMWNDFMAYETILKSSFILSMIILITGAVVYSISLIVVIINGIIDYKGAKDI
jgi:hypothetical protein